jgi:hypothetical protein
MPFCPICKSKYSAGEVKCINCKCDLVEELPQNKNYTETFLVSANDGIELAMIEGRLRSARIPYYIKNKETGAYMKVLMGYSVFGVDIYVPSNLLSKAMEILQIENADTGEDAIAYEYANGYESENEFEEQPLEQENEELLNETKQQSMRFYAMIFLSILFSPALLVVLIFWLLCMGFINCIKFIKKRL